MPNLKIMGEHYLIGKLAQLSRPNDLPGRSDHQYLSGSFVLFISLISKTALLAIPTLVGIGEKKISCIIRFEVGV